MELSWAEIVCPIPAALADDFAAFLVDLSGNGVTLENREVDTFSLDTIQEAEMKEVKAYFPADENLHLQVDRILFYLNEHAPEVPGFEPACPRISIIGEEDWANSWKQHFAATRIGSRLMIKPTWEKYLPKGDDVIIEIDPGMAFGTGTHATTRLCLELLEDILLGVPPFPSFHNPVQVLDVGTGSGILAIAASKLGAARVLAIDIDPKAISVAAENAERNGVTAAVTLSTALLSEVDSQYGIVLANIIAEELVRLKEELLLRTSPGGFLVLSGILSERKDFVKEAFGHSPVTLLAERSSDEWCSLCFRHDR